MIRPNCTCGEFDGLWDALKKEQRKVMNCYTEFRSGEVYQNWVAQINPLLANRNAFHDRVMELEAVIKRIQQYVPDEDLEANEMLSRALNAEPLEPRP